MSSTCSQVTQFPSLISDGLSKLRSCVQLHRRKRFAYSMQHHWSQPRSCPSQTLFSSSDCMFRVSTDTAKTTTALQVCCFCDSENAYKHEQFEMLMFQLKRSQCFGDCVGDLSCYCLCWVYIQRFFTSIKCQNVNNFASKFPFCSHSCLFVDHVHPVFP